jgi:CBS domain-containing protein
MFFHLIFEVIAMRVQEILQRKGKTVHQISPSETLADVVERLVSFNCGSLLVTESDEVLGIITERDILKAIDSQKRNLGELIVSDFMTRNLITGLQCDDVNKLMGLMTTHRIRHLPILDQGKLAGMISIGDLVKAQCDSLSAENHQLMSYIQGQVS